MEWRKGNWSLKFVSLTHDSTRTDNIRPNRFIVLVLFDDSNFRLFLIRSTAITRLVILPQVFNSAVLDSDLIIDKNCIHYQNVSFTCVRATHMIENTKNSLNATFNWIRKFLGIGRNVLEERVSTKLATIGCCCLMVARVFSIRKREPIKSSLSGRNTSPIIHFREE